jgi:hypothetical protein
MISIVNYVPIVVFLLLKVELTKKAFKILIFQN